MLMLNFDYETLAVNMEITVWLPGHEPDELIFQALPLVNNYKYDQADA